MLFKFIGVIWLPDSTRVSNTNRCVSQCFLKLNSCAACGPRPNFAYLNYSNEHDVGNSRVAQRLAGVLGDVGIEREPDRIWRPATQSSHSGDRMPTDWKTMHVHLALVISC